MGDFCGDMVSEFLANLASHEKCHPKRQQIYAVENINLLY